MNHANSKLIRLSRRRLLGWAGAGTCLGALAACHGTSPSGTPSSPVNSSEPSPVAEAPAPTRAAPPASTPTPDALAKLNYLHTDGPLIRDQSGREVILTGLNWFGLETDNLAPHGIWARSYQSMLDQIVQSGFNCLRLPFSNELFDPKLTPNGIDFSQNPDLKGLNGLEIMDKIIVEAGKRQLKIILDQHRPTTDSQSDLWYTVELTTKEWTSQWQALARRYLGNDAVIGADLHNEPAGPATWGSNDPTTDWAAAAQDCANAIHEINPYWLIFVEGVEKVEDQFGNVMDWTWQGGELVNARVRPINLKVPNRLVYSAHDYGPSVYKQGWFSDPTFPKNLPGFWDFHWGYLLKRGVAPVWIGEFGGPSVGNDPEGIWQRTIVDYMKTNKMHYTYWAFNANSADTGGLLEPDWKTINPDKERLLKTYQGRILKNLAPTVVNTSEVPVVSPNRLPIKALHYDATGIQWATVLKPELYIMNKTLDAMALSDLEMRYWFAPNGNDTASGIQVQIRGTSTADFGKTLSGDLVKADVVESTASFGGNPLMYVRLTFANGAQALKRDAAGFGLQVQKKDGSQFFQPSHYSYRDYHWPSEWERVGIYKAGTLVWGMNPQTYQSEQLAKQRQLEEKLAKVTGR
ncbi:MAG TPA: glycoside hydrolase family 5 protein [Chloroflexota bacterium]|nr:glycoside hydrolase family 5 protein [Chloroflexota bacterium]